MVLYGRRGNEMQRHKSLQRQQVNQVHPYVGLSQEVLDSTLSRAAPGYTTVMEEQHSSVLEAKAYSRY